MKHITNELLLESYELAKGNDFDQVFLLLLETEIRKRTEHTQRFWPTNSKAPRKALNSNARILLPR
ncbi:sporulation histidine kinase inhibitor Sda [Salicibibacter cibarius]|uniref:Sporulation histidine kinase inhibitor Sda n=1 Tax=Salicibibacter cibarius TaxID=2743000 RepID=A0A7T7C9W9_9BACI|nr:sporulation histidine kinase inhibitor Sda [Salicibibacter cibarius]